MVNKMKHTLPKITCESILAQIGHHRTPMDDIIDALDVFLERKENENRSNIRVCFRGAKFTAILISLWWTGAIESYDGSDVWIPFEK